ncbi:replication-relaxation family protein [Hamadaea tsunoensis]|uniref:replication-relaxation family protein n=1 Tax=Hamadaea tsunoensis TaxID=53368 RepID=UPI0003FF0803
MTKHITHDPVLRLQHQLTQRDWRLLGWLHDHRVLTTFQIANALFPTLNYAQRRLTQLTGLGLLERFRPFRLQGGSYPYHYALAYVGELVVAASRGMPPPRRADSTARLHRIATSRNLDHRLGINDFFTGLAGYERKREGAQLHHWWPDTRLERFTPPGTTAFGYPQADALGVWTEDRQTVVFYLEHDTGYEALTVLADKVRRYTEFHRRGAPAWPVLFWLHSTVREQHLHRRLAETATRFPIATAARDRLDGRTPAEAIWRLASGAPTLLRLAALPMPTPADLAAFDTETRS